MITVLTRHNGLPMVFQPAPSFDFFEPARVQVLVEEESEYEEWRQWRYEHISLEFELWRDNLAYQMWQVKKPSWMIW